MGVWIANEPQTIAVGGNVLFDNADGCSCAVTHRTGSGLFTLHGGKRYRLSFGANVSGATAGVEVDLAISINGEAIPATTMASTPAVADDLNNISRTIEITVPCGCCWNVAIRNVGATALTVANAYLSISKEN